MAGKQRSMEEMLNEFRRDAGWEVKAKDKREKDFHAERKRQNRAEDNAFGNDENNGGGYVGAPYNFVPFYDKVYEYPENKLTDHDSMDENLITGELIYEITAKTSIMIDDGTGQFYRGARGRYAIPGSTMRGLIRNNVQVLGLCSYADDVDDYALMYRDVVNVAKAAKGERYRDILGSNVRAGYVKNEGGKYVIYQTVVDPIKTRRINYYVLSERKIVNDYLKNGKKSSYAFFCQNGKSILQHEFEQFYPYKGQDGRKHYKGTENQDYRPYNEKISYEVAHGKDITAVGCPEEYSQKGYAVSTGKIEEKKAVYIIPEIDKSKESISIPEEDIRAFRIDLKKKEGTLGQFGGTACFDLPEEGEMRPVFYFKRDEKQDGRLYFGFTPMLRLFYDHTVKEGLRQQCKTDGVDYARAMFGYVSPEKSYKSKLSFSDAVLKKSAEFGQEKKLILAEPKPTSYLDYLKQDGSGTVTYNTDNFTLRGAKQYWLHSQPVQAEDPVENENVASDIRPLKEKAEFVGKIRFQNLTEDELGLLLWAVRLNEGSQMNVGKAKAYGYGRISVKIKEAKKLDMSRAYRAEEILCLDPFCEIEVERMIECYKKEISKHLDSRQIDELPHIQDFFIMKDAGQIPDYKKSRYMRIDKKEYQSRDEALPSIRSVAGRE